MRGGGGRGKSGGVGFVREIWLDCGVGGRTSMMSTGFSPCMYGAWILWTFSMRASRRMVTCWGVLFLVSGFLDFVAMLDGLSIFAAISPDVPRRFFV